METKLEYSKSSFSGKPLKRLFSMLSQDIREVVYIYIYAIFNGIINLTLPLGIQAIIGMIIGGQFSTSWAILIFIVVLGVAVTGGMQIMQMSLTEILQQRIFTRASFEFAYRIPRFSPKSINDYYPPELINRFFDVMSVQKGLPKILIEFSTAALQILFGLLLLAFYHPFFVFFGVTLVAVLILIVVLTGPKGLQTGLKESKYKYEVAHWLEEMARTMDTFKLSGTSTLPLEKMNVFTSNYLKARQSHFKVLLWQYGNIVVFKTVIVAGLLILGSILMIQQEINLGQFVASEIIILLVLASVEKLMLSMESIYDVLVGLEKVGHITDIPLEGEQGTDFKAFDTGKGISVKAKNLYYRYPNAENDTLKNVNFEIKPGEKVCLAGFNSAGKSTLADLVAGLHDGYQGSLVYNNAPMGNIEISSLRTVIGDNLRQEDLFYGSLQDNLTMGNPEISSQNILDTLSAIKLSEYLENTETGLNTHIDPEGKKLSSSIKRKMLLARSLVKKPKLLVLEDFMTNLDYDDCECIIDFIVGKKHAWTVFAISNDPIIAKRCDRILILKEGEIVDDDTFEEIQKKPYFRSVFR